MTDVNIPLALGLRQWHISGDAAHEAGGVDEHIDRAEALHDRGDSRLDLLAPAGCQMALVPSSTAAERSLAASRSSGATRAPSRAKAAATARPIPLEPPVVMTVLFISLQATP